MCRVVVLRLVFVCGVCVEAPPQHVLINLYACMCVCSVSPTSLHPPVFTYLSSPTLHTATPPLPSHLMDQAQQALDMAWHALQEELAGMWADAMLPMVHAEWTDCRAQLMQTRSATTTVAVQSWMQAVQWKQVARCVTGSAALYALSIVSWPTIVVHKTADL